MTNRPEPEPEPQLQPEPTSVTALPAQGGPPNKSLGPGAVAGPGYGFQALTQRGAR